ncbi:hypothetical protein ZIOFF_027547 [Zingiber officinale]|uniref:Uncharacterized protein n=1 Tax=Zingiber officinale TaxID=94328 RepID=A0A8J5GYR5_ZINOF|nr:hypothetical protein ZIOFF_027547 [Zingiber officinale]
MGEGAGFQLGTVGALSLSVVSSVSIVICNKALMSSLGFKFDDKTSNHSLYCLLGDGLFCKEVQMTNTIQKKFKVSSTQLLYQSALYQSLTLFVSGPFLDGLLTNQNVFGFNYTTQVLVSFHCAFLPNISLCQLQYISCNWQDITSQQKAREATAQMLQGKDNESDPLMRAEVGAGVNTDGSAPTSQIWSSNKDLSA